MNTEKIPHRTVPLTPFRKLIIDGLDVGINKHYIKGFIELDVTQARQRIRQYRRETRQSLSFTAFFMSCVVRALQENMSLNAGLKGNTIIIFDDIDISVAIEMELNGEKVPRLMVIRQAQNKSAQEINDEIEAAQSINQKEGDVVQGDARTIKPVLRLLKLPKFIRMPIWRHFLREPFFTKRMMGTVGITAVGMFGNISGWPEPIPTSNHAFSCALGSITKKPRVVRGDIAIREILHATLLFDHDIVDGAPAARFTDRLRHLVENGDIV